jgi:hypothetical protein
MFEALLSPELGLADCSDVYHEGPAGPQRKSQVDVYLDDLTTAPAAC